MDESIDILAQRIMEAIDRQAMMIPTYMEQRVTKAIKRELKKASTGKDRRSQI